MKPGILAGASLAAILTGAAFAQGVPIKLATSLNGPAAAHQLAIRYSPFAVQLPLNEL